MSILIKVKGKKKKKKEEKEEKKTWNMFNFDGSELRILSNKAVKPPPSPK